MANTHWSQTFFNWHIVADDFREILDSQNSQTDEHLLINLTRHWLQLDPPTIGSVVNYVYQKEKNPFSLRPQKGTFIKR